MNHEDEQNEGERPVEGYLDKHRLDANAGMYARQSNEWAGDARVCTAQNKSTTQRESTMDGAASGRAGNRSPNCDLRRLLSNLHGQKGRRNSRGGDAGRRGGLNRSYCGDMLLKGGSGAMQPYPGSGLPRKFRYENERVEILII